MLKKTLVLGLLTAILFCCSTMHTIDGVLLETDKEDNVVLAYYETADGNVWVNEHNSTLEVGESCRIFFYNNLTPNNIYDDVIITIF